MKNWLILAFIGIALAQTTVTPDEEGYLRINDESYNQVVAETDPKILFFYSATDCNNCEKIKTTLAGQISYLKQFSIPVFLVNCAEATTACRRRLNNRKPPAIIAQISTKFLYYYGDYSAKSLKDFMTKRLVEERVRQFSPEFYKSEIERTKRDQQAIVIYRGDSVFVKDDLIKPLSHFEADDTYLFCTNDSACDKLFPDKMHDLMFIKAERKAFFVADKIRNFDDIHSSFYTFKNIFFIPFGIEFKKKVLEEMNPTVVLFLRKNGDLTAAENDLEVFRSTMANYAKRTYASVIKESSLQPAQTRLFEELKNELGIDNLPRLMILEADMDTMKLQKYAYPYLDLKTNELAEFLNNWIGGKLEPSKRSERVPAGQEYQGVEVLNYDRFKEKVYKKGQESVILAHRGLKNDNKSRKFFELLRRLKGESEFASLSWFVIDAEKNDLPVFYSKLPSILIFTKNSWENPLVYDAEDYNKLREVTRKRRELVIDLNTAAEKSEEFGDGDGQSNGQKSTSYDDAHEDEL